MFFTKVGRGAAYLFATLALARIVAAVLVANGTLPPEYHARYLGSHTTGEIIDASTYVLVGSLFLGILAEISLSLRNRA